MRSVLRRPIFTAAAVVLTLGTAAACSSSSSGGSSGGSSSAKSITVLSFGTQSQANLAVSSGRADVGMADSPVAGYIVTQSHGAFKLSGQPYGTAPYGIAVPKKAGTLDKAVLLAVQDLMKDGTYNQILTKWNVAAGAIGNPTINGATTPTQPAPAPPSTVTPPALNAAAAQLVPANIKSKGTLTVAEDASYAPDEYLAPDGKTVIGMDADLAKAIGTELGMSVKIQNITFNAIIPGLSDGRFDLGLSSFTDNTDREKPGNFVTYLSAGTSFYVLANGGPTLSGLASLCGHKVAVESGTTEETDAKTESTKCATGG